MEYRWMSFFGLFVVLGLAALLSSDRRSINPRLVLGGLGLQFLLASIVLKTSFGQMVFSQAQSVVTAMLDLSDNGSKLVFGDNFRDHFFAFKVLPTIIFVSSLSYLLFYWGVVQKFVQGLSWVMRKFMDISSVEALVTSANIFCGQTEAPLFVKPYIKKMTVSEINTMMTGGMATVAGGVLAAYVGMGISAGHLLAASLIAAPGAIVISKIIYPEVDLGDRDDSTVSPTLEVDSSNAIEAACNGASEGLKLALNVAAMLIAFMALVALGNMMLASIGGLFGFSGLSLEALLGLIFRPIAFCLGVSWKESYVVAQLIGEKMIVNEFYAYTHLSRLLSEGLLSERAVVLSTYALCGFANISSIAIQIGGIGALEPSRKKDFAACGVKAMLGGTLSALMSACIAGVLLS